MKKSNLRKFHRKFARRDIDINGTLTPPMPSSALIGLGYSRTFIGVQKTP
jgi:hypothetical protein